MILNEQLRKLSLDIFSYDLPYGEQVDATKDEEMAAVKEALSSGPPSDINSDNMSTASKPLTSKKGKKGKVGKKGDNKDMEEEKVIT